MNCYHSLRRINIYLVLALLTASCATFTPIEHGPLENAIESGDVVSIHTTNSPPIQITVTSIDHERIIGDTFEVENTESKTILIEDITQIEKKQTSFWKSYILVSLVAGVLFYDTVIDAVLSPWE